MKFSWLICPFWGHDWEQIKVPVIKTNFQETANYQEICKRCGAVTEAYGMTTFSFQVEVKDE